MKHTDLFKVVPIAAIVMSVYSSTAMAGATNRGDNTAATPGPKATTTTTPADGATGREDMRRGTTRTKSIDTPDSPSDLNHPDEYSENRKGAMDIGQDAGTGSAGGSGDVDTRTPDPTDGSTNY